MRILIDTNVLISSLVFPTSTIAKTFIYIASRYDIVLTTQNIDEFIRIIQKKWPSKINDAKS